jgi:hypothetical protein
MTPWELFRQHIEVTTNRGILLLLLLFALACSLGVAFLTLIRWIVFPIKEKTKCHKSQVCNANSLRPAINGHKHSNIYESWVKLDFFLEFSHRKYIRIDITTLGREHGRVCLADGNSHISPFVNFVCQGKFTTSIP